MEETKSSTILDTRLQMLINNKQSGVNYKERKSEDWRQNYELYRDRVQTNRLTQRQSVHIPFMKQTIRTLLKDIDDMPSIHFENLDSDKQKEVFLNEYWTWTVEQNNMEIKDIADKKQEMFFGRSFDQIQIVDGKIKFSIVDPEDILVSRYTDPTDIDTSRFLIHQHIYLPLAVLENTPEYDQEAVKDLKIWYGTNQGLIKIADNAQKIDEKEERLANLGVLDAYSPVLGETYVELSMHFTYKKNGDAEELYLFVEAENMKILLEKPLKEVIGPTEDDYWANHFPYNSWADDVDMQDFWTDGVADICRPGNVILDVWFSQLVENRTLRSFGMNLFNSNLEGFAPQTWQPMPFGAYGIPIPEGENIQQHIQRVDIPDLSESLDEMRYVQEMSERATGATATQQGVQTERKITLGEVELALGEAKSRIKGMSKFYTKVWEQRAKKFLKMIEAAGDRLDAVKVYKKGRNTDEIYSKEIGPNDWQSKSGYRVKIWSQEDKDETDTKMLNSLNAAVTNMPGNKVLLEEFQKKLLEFSKLSPEKIVEIIEAQKQMAMIQEQMQQSLAMAGQAPETPAPQPAPTPAPKPNPEVLGKLKGIRNKLKKS